MAVASLHQLFGKKNIKTHHIKNTILYFSIYYSKLIGKIPRYYNVSEPYYSKYESILQYLFLLQNTEAYINKV